jgi:hypothetical protein
MPRGVKKENLPSKVCVVCNRPFTWRKKWERCWDEVTTCSKACNATRRQLKGAAAIHSETDGSDGEHVDKDGPCAASDADDVKHERKAAAKAAKALTRAKRECSAPKETGQKLCDACGRGSDLLVRCQTDASQAWRMVCGKCWRIVSGGQVDGDSNHPHYRYGGLWKNRKAALAVGIHSLVGAVADTLGPSSKNSSEAAPLARLTPAPAARLRVVDAPARAHECALSLTNLRL